MQLVAIFLLLCTIPLTAQIVDTTKKEKVDVHFLLNYYDQDGVHSAVTGGRGTEELTDYSSQIIINVPLDTLSKLSATAGINYYTSASSDKIDFVVSSASRADYHAHMNVTYHHKIAGKNMWWWAGGGGAVESDYVSGNIQGGLSFLSEDENREFSATWKFFFDTWQLIFPDELRSSGQNYVQTDKRRTGALQLVYSICVIKKTAGGLFL